MMINEQTIRLWWDIFKSPNQLTEIRIIGKGRSATYSGYFKDVETMLAELRRTESYGGIYATINEIDDACFGREQTNRIIKASSTTSDTEITRRKIILIDFDPERPADTNATDEQVKLAEKRMREVYKYLLDQGFNAPVVAMSANGYHLYYKVDMPNTNEERMLIERFLKALDMMFGDDKVKVDTSVFNASRIAKLIGTQSTKGVSTDERPQRMSHFVHIPDIIKETPIEYIKKVAAELPEAPKPSRENHYRTDKFDIDGFLNKHNIQVDRRSRFNGGEKIILHECPFNSNHKDAALFVLDNGGISFKCFHNSCQQYGWRDFLLRYEPDSFGFKEKEEYQRRRDYYSSQPQRVDPVILKEDERGKKWLSMSEIKWIDPASFISIPTGIVELDNKIMGLSLGDITILSGLSGSGKTTLLNHFILNAVQRNYKCAAWSGELQDFRFQAWLNQMAAGKANVVPKYGYSNLYYCPESIAKKINKWLDGKFWLYNNDYGSGFEQILSDVSDQIRDNGVQLILLDNLMALDLDTNGTENERQTALIKKLKQLAKKENIHIVLVCHPRKEQSFQLLRKESIAGTANLTNLCDNLLIAHRIGNDFEKRARDFFGEQIVADMMKYQLVIEIAKNRSLGIVDYLIGLYYENETRRIKNDIAENIVYGWQDSSKYTTPSVPKIDDLPL